jgi:hypothetical protein
MLAALRRARYGSLLALHISRAPSSCKPNATAQRCGAVCHSLCSAWFGNLPFGSTPPLPRDVALTRGGP